MIKRFSISWLVLIASICSVVWAQSELVGAELTDRSRLAQERKEIETRYSLQEAACYKKFAVSNCLKIVKTEKSEALIEIKRKELVLNDLLREERKAKIEEKKASQKRSITTENGNLTSKTIKSITAEEKNRAQLASNRVDEANRKRRASEAKAVQRAEKGKQAAELASKHQQKLKEAQEHKVAVEQKNASSTKPKAAPLPIPKSTTD